MDGSSREVGRHLPVWAQWLLASAVGTLAGGLLSGVAQVLRLSLSPADLAIIGALLGLAQWPVLRHVIPQSLLWVPATAVGNGLGIWLLTVLAAVMTPPFWLSVPLLFGQGFFLGLCQWWLLRPGTSRAGWWIVASFIGSLVAGVLAAIVLNLVGRGLIVGIVPVGATLASVARGVIYGLVTGPVLDWLLRPQIRS